VAHDRIASEAMLAAWPLDSSEVLLFVDLDAALKTELVFPRLFTSIGELASQVTPAAQVSCIRDALLASKELVMGADRAAHTLITARFDPSHAPQFRACLGERVDPTTVRGAGDAWSLGSDVAATSDDLLLMGNKENVEAAIAADGRWRRGTASVLAFTWRARPLPPRFGDRNDRRDGVCHVRATLREGGRRRTR
jgi:hypothetical protein